MNSYKEFLSPEEIEKRSFKIIEEELGDLNLPEGEKEVIKRVAHATADPEFAKGIIFHPEAIEKGIFSLKSGRDIITDVEMVKAGVRIKELKIFGNKIFCFLNNKRVLEKARHEGLPRSVLAMRQAIPCLNRNIVVIGNAPTALFEVVRLIKKREISPSLVIGIPVGFVGAAESKEALRTSSVPYITNKGRRGGSAAACAIINALIKLVI